MSVIKSFCSAFLMYSKIPVPQVEWKEENRRYAFCFFPFIGAVIGALIYFCYLLLGTNNIIFGAVAVAVPVLITGGIHLDGFCDVSDALASGTKREKMLEIMSDPRVGSFAVIKLVLYILIQFALFVSAGKTAVILCAFGFIQSRCYSALGAVLFKSAKSESTLSYFKNPAYKKITVITEIFYIAITSVFMVLLNIRAIFIVLAGIAVFLFYRIYAYNKFGGITGDTEGWFLQIFELIFLIVTEVVLWF